MSAEYLTAKELSQRYCGAITIGTLAAWRSMKKGPPYTKIGDKVLYPIVELKSWEKLQGRNEIAGLKKSSPPARGKT